MRVFPSRASLTRLVGMVLFEQDDEWQDGRRYFSPESMDDVPWSGGEVTSGAARLLHTVSWRGGDE